MSVQHPDDLLAAFALDALTDEERESVRLHVAECAQCRQTVARFESTSDALALSIDDVPAPTLDLRDRILREAARTEQVRPPAAAAPTPIRVAPRRRNGWYGWLVAAALFLVVLVFGARDLSLSRQLEALQRPTTIQGELVATVDAVGANGRYSLDRNHDGILVVTHLPPPTPGQVYEAWVIDSGGPKAAGTFVTTPDGKGTVVLTLPAEQGVTLAITNEPSPGTTAPTGKILLKATVT